MNSYLERLRRTAWEMRRMLEFAVEVQADKATILRLTLAYRDAAESLAERVVPFVEEEA